MVVSEKRTFIAITTVALKEKLKSEIGVKRETFGR
jgi:hypothetical protein